MLLALVVATASCGDDDTGGGGPSAVSVETVTVEAATLRDVLRGTGAVDAVETIELRTETAGTVEALRFEEGARVRRGDVLAVIDTEPLERELEARRAAREAALARARLARRTLERVETLHGRGSASRDELDRARSGLDQAEADAARLAAEIEALSERLDDARIRAPVAGEVSERLVDVGDFVDVGTPVAVLYTTGLLELAFTLPESALGRLAPGQEVAARTAALGDDVVAGEIGYISPSIDPATRTVRLKARVDDPDPRLRPGAFAAVEVTVETRSDRPTVPEEALVSTRTGYLLFVVDDDGVARRREVSIGLREPGRVEITDGVEVGETVVRAGHMSVSDGTAVEVVDDLPGAGAGAPTQ